MNEFERLMMEQGLVSKKKGAKPSQKIEKKIEKKKNQSDLNFEQALSLYGENAPSIKQKGQIEKHKITFRELKKAIAPEDIHYELDLHRFSLDDAKKTVKQLLQTALREEYRNILIITGKGKHSPNGPILKVGIRQYLMTFPDLIDEITYAPAMLGGEGAFLVKLR